MPLELVAGPADAFAGYDIDFPSIWDYWSNPTGKSRGTGTPGCIPQVARKTDIFILPVFDFEFRFQRPQQFANELAKAGHRVFWLSPSRFLKPDSGRDYEAILLRDNLYEIRVRGPELNIYSASLSESRAQEVAAGTEKTIG